MSHFEVRPYNSAPTLFKDGQPSFAAIYTTIRNFPSSTADWQADPHFEQFRDAGFHYYSIEVPTSFDDAYDAETGEFKPDAFARMALLQRYVELDPQAHFLLRVGTEPRGDHSAWLRKYPGECEQLEPRSKGRTYLTQSFASQVWLDDAAQFIRTLIRYLTDHGLSEHMLGYLICAGGSGEWGKDGHMEDWAGDYSPAAQNAFRKWLRARYANDVMALRHAWADPLVDFEQDLVPTPEEQNDTDLFLFKDPSKRHKAIDHFQFYASVSAGDIDFLCGVAKEACHGQHLAGVFYGYIQEMLWNNGFFGQGLPDADVEHAALARSGHAGLKQVLASPRVDFLSSPYAYIFRGTGGEGGFMSPEASVQRAGKLWISEEDMRTHLWTPNSFYGQARNTRETSEVLKRQLANILTRASGAWWCDWNKPTGGAYAEPELMAIFKRALECARHQLNLPDRSSAAEVVIVNDAESCFYRTTRNNLDIPTWRNRAWGIARMGVPVDCILLSDLLESRARDYKLYVFINTVHLTSTDRVQLKSILRRDGKVALWIYAPGFVDDEKLSVENCNDIAGIRLRMTERQWGAHIYVSNFDHAITRNLPTSTFWGTDMRLGPLFTVDDMEATTLGTVVINQGRCEPGFVLREVRDTAGRLDWASVYSAAPAIPAGVLKELARFSGAHIYSESEDVFYADHNYVALHTVRAEVKTIRLPRRADVWEVYSNRQVGHDCTEFSDWMAAGSTHLYYFGPAPRP